MPPLLTQKINPRTKRLEDLARRCALPDGPLEFRERMAAKMLAELDAPPRRSRFFPYRNIAADYLEIGQFRQLMGDTAACKENFRLAAQSLLEAHRYFDSISLEDQGQHGGSVNLLSRDFFQGAVLAGERDLALELGEKLMAGDQTGTQLSFQAMAKAKIYLYAGKDQAVRAQCEFVRQSKGKRWTHKAYFLEIDVLDALLDMDNQRFYDAFVVLFRRDRRDPYIDLLDLGLIMLGRIALSRGLELPVDTMECPRALMLPEEGPSR